MGRDLTSPRAANTLARMAYQSDVALGELAAFTAVVDAQGFTAASRLLGVRKATLSARVQRLEQRLGASLLARTTRALRLTDEGRAYLEHARRAIASARAAESAVVSTRAAPSGTLRVSVPPPLGALLLNAVIAPYLSAHPAVTVQLDTATRTVDLVKDEFDVAIRVGALGDSALIARKLGVAAGGYYASPAYLARHGEPKRPRDLPNHDAIVIPRGDRAPEWHFVEGRRRRSIVVKPRLAVNGFELGLEAAVAGLGIVPSPLFCVQALLNKKQLVPVLAAYTPPGFEVHAVFPASAALVPKTRAFVDLLAAWADGHSGRFD